MIYTSYFAKINYLPKNMIPISICAKPPAWYKGLQYKKLAPPYHVLMEYKERHNYNNYIRNYNAQILDKLEANEVVNDLKSLICCSHSKDIVLLCYERPHDFCHRHLVSRWLNDNGFECEELI